VKGLEKNSLPSRHQASKGEHSLRLAKQPSIQGLVLLILAGVMLCWLGIFPSLPAPTSEVAGVPSALVGRMRSMWMEQRMLPLLCRAVATRC
jgi:hypothetical protein